MINRFNHEALQTPIRQPSGVKRRCFILVDGCGPCLFMQVIKSLLCNKVFFGYTKLYRILQNYYKKLISIDQTFPKIASHFLLVWWFQIFVFFSTPTYLGKKIQFDKSIFQMGTQNDTAAQRWPNGMVWHTE